MSSSFNPAIKEGWGALGGAGDVGSLLDLGRERGDSSGFTHDDVCRVQDRVLYYLSFKHLRVLVCTAPTDRLDM